MSLKKDVANDVLNRKIELLFKFRKYSVKHEVEDKNFKDVEVVKRGEKGKILIRTVYRTPLKSGNVGVRSVRRMKKKIEKGGYRSGIMIGKGFTYSARKESKANNIEAIPEKKIPAFNIFNHHLVPKHEILPRNEVEELLKKYHAEPHQLPRIKASDSAAFLIGAQAGDILKITRESPTAGVHVTYRYVF